MLNEEWDQKYSKLNPNLEAFVSSLNPNRLTEMDEEINILLRKLNSELGVSFYTTKSAESTITILAKKRDKNGQEESLVVLAVSLFNNDELSDVHIMIKDRKSTGTVFCKRSTMIETILSALKTSRVVGLELEAFMGAK
jgi:hypothetical protein